MKQLLLLCSFLICGQLLMAQTYPNPEFANEVYAYRKDSNTLVRLEKDFAKMATKTKFGGMGGMDYGYAIDSERSTVRFGRDGGYSFVYWTGAGSSGTSDSVMRANGMDPSMFSGMGTDPSQMISLYQAESSKGKRNISLITAQGMGLLGKAKKESKKYSFSVKKIREGYYEMIIDKPLPKGEYAFILTASGTGSGMDGSYPVFAFAVE